MKHPSAYHPSSRLERLARTRVYIVATPAAHGPAWLDALGKALATGLVGMVQLREKTIDDDAYLARALMVRDLCAAHDALFIVNDRVHLARNAGADGAHVGQGDLPCEEARELLGPDLLLGLSTHDTAELASARPRGADHVGLGPCFPTGSKRLHRPTRGADLVRETLGAAGSLPVFSIGGITPENVALLAAEGAARVAVGAGVLKAQDPAAAVLRLHAILCDSPLET